MTTFIHRLLALVFAAAMVAAPVVLDSGEAAAAVHADNTFNTGETLAEGDEIRSANGRYRAAMQTDNNFVLYDTSTGDAIWAAMSNGDGIARFVIGDDGNAVVLNGDSVVWQSHTAGFPGPVRMVVQDDGALVLYGPGGPHWTTDSHETSWTRRQGIAPAAGYINRDGQLLIPGTVGPPAAAPRPVPVRPEPELADEAPEPQPEPAPEHEAYPTGPVPRSETVSVEGIWVHRTIAVGFQEFMDLAKAEGVNLSGWGWRDHQDQLRLRKANCGDSDFAIYEMASSLCNPPTARPGRSRHERGTAIDFTYNDDSIRSHKNPGFIYIRDHAHIHGLCNLPSEEWHWSVDCH